jgi:hypothetical protein
LRRRKSITAHRRDRVQSRRTQGRPHAREQASKPAAIAHIGTFAGKLTASRTSKAKAKPSRMPIKPPAPVSVTASSKIRLQIHSPDKQDKLFRLSN